MAFGNLTLLAGAGLIAIPIILHLVMKQEPKRLVFPALRFLQNRQHVNRRRLQLRHWILLALRCLAIAFLALTLAQPTTPVELFGNWITVVVLLFAGMGIGALAARFHGQEQRRPWFWGTSITAALALLIALSLGFYTLAQDSAQGARDANSPIAAAIVIDTSPRMDYRHNNASRIEEAQKIARWLIQRLPRDSEVAILDSRPAAAAFSIDLAAASATADRLRSTTLARPLVETIRGAINLLETKPEMRHELYVVSDLTIPAWSGVAASELKEDLAAAPQVAVYMLDVGVTDPQNIQLGDLELSAEKIAPNQDLTIKTTVTQTGGTGAHRVQLFMEEPDDSLPVLDNGEIKLPEPRLRGEQIVETSETGTQTVEFHVSGLPRGVHQGWLQLVGDDGFAIDNRRYLTVEVTETSPLLVVATEDIESSFFTEAIAPLEFVRTDRTQYVLTKAQPNELTTRKLADYAAICLLDPPPISAVAWESLASYVRDGGRVCIFLGHNANQSDRFNIPAAQQLLPGTLSRQWRAAGREVYPKFDALDHPIVKAFQEVANSTPWYEFPVFRHWVLDDVATSTRVAMRMNNRKPLIFDKKVGRGRVVTMTTPISDPAQPERRAAWNELPTGENAWPFFVLVNEIMRYAVSADDDRINFSVGDYASVSNSASRFPDRYQLFTPSAEIQDLSAFENRVSVRFTEMPGAYRLKGNRNGPVSRGFSVNLQERASDFRRVTPEQLANTMGEGRFQLLREHTQLSRILGTTRQGRPLYPYLLALVAILLAVENLLANRFYRDQDDLKPTRTIDKSLFRPEASTTSS